jgi:hypothetical protein
VVDDRFLEHERAEAEQINREERSSGVTEALPNGRIGGAEGK